VVGLAFDGHVTAALNGDQITGDPQVPLAAGDTVLFMSAGTGAEMAMPELTRHDLASCRTNAASLAATATAA
jgi:hypothetical protein